MALDHVAVRVADRELATRELIELLEVRVLQRDARLTLLGTSDAAGKITLLDAVSGATSPAIPGRLASICVAAPDAAIPSGPLFLRCGLTVSFDTSIRAARHALVGVTLRVRDAPAAAAALQRHAMTVISEGEGVAVLGVGPRVADGWIRVVEQPWTQATVEAELDHVGIRVGDALDWRRRALESGRVEEHWVEAAHSRAVFLSGPEDLLLEFVEQTASFGSMA